MITDAAPKSFDDELPAKVDVVIVGAGVIGICTALHLAKQKLSVLVCDKGRVAGEQSSRNWGWIRQQGRDAGELPIMIESIDLWETLAGELNEDIGFTRQGIAFAASSDKELAAVESWLKVAEPHQLDTHMLDGKTAAQLLGLSESKVKGALVTPSDGRAEPFVAVPALARHLRHVGGLIKEDCAVRSLDIQAGRIQGVITEHGAVAADAVLCAAGAWSNVLLGNHDIDLPQLLVRGTVARTAPVKGGYDGAMALGNVGVRRRQDGGYTVASGLTEHFVGANSLRYFAKYVPAMRENAGNIAVRFGGDLFGRLFAQRHWSADEPTVFEKTRVLNPEPSTVVLNKIRKALEEHFPDIGAAPFEQTWAGMIDAMPDVVPVMDQVASCPGLFIATGFSAHGFGIGPGAGRVMGDLILGNNPGHDLNRFRYMRFYDGTQMQPGPGL